MPNANPPTASTRRSGLARSRCLIATPTDEADQLHHDRPGGCSDQRDERRVGRLGAGRQHVRSEPRTGERADHTPAADSAPSARPCHSPRSAVPATTPRMIQSRRVTRPGTLASLMDGAALEELIDRYNAAWNAHDVDAIVDMHTSDSVFENHTTGDVNVGREAIGNAIRGIFTVFPDLGSRPVGATSATTSSCRSGRRAGRTSAR